MSDPAAALKTFVMEILTDLGAEVSVAGPLVWVRAPEMVRRRLDVPSTFALAFDAAHSGEFDAEFVAPGSYILEKVISLATRRGRWDVARFESREDSWPAAALDEAGLGPASGVVSSIGSIEEDLLLVFSFRVVLVADEKRETYHRIAVSIRDGFVTELESDPDDTRTIPAEFPQPRPDLESSYRIAAESLRSRTQVDLDAFRTKNLALLDEEVRRIFGYFDSTVDEVRESDPDRSQDLIRAIMTERDRRLTEAVERFDPTANATLCAVRALFVPTARIRVVFADGSDSEVRVDAVSRRIRGLRCAACQGSSGPWQRSENQLVCGNCAPTRGASAPLPARPPSDTPRRGTRADRGAVRSPRESKGRSRAASSGRRRS